MYMYFTAMAVLCLCMYILMRALPIIVAPRVSGQTNFPSFPNQSERVMCPCSAADMTVLR